MVESLKVALGRLADGFGYNVVGVVFADGGIV